MKGKKVHLAVCPENPEEVNTLLKEMVKTGCDELVLIVPESRTVDTQGAIDRVNLICSFCMKEVAVDDATIYGAPTGGLIIICPKCDDPTIHRVEDLIDKIKKGGKG